MKKNQIALLIAALGVWLIAMPLTFGYSGDAVGISDLISGLLLIVFGLLSQATNRMWSGWFAGIIGLWLQLAPIIFWAPNSLMYINDTLIGAISIILSFRLVQKKTVAKEAEIPAGWSYNPSGWSHRVPVVGLAILCWFFARYMAAYQLGYIDAIWDPIFKNGTLHVITSTISMDFPVSDAGMGAVCYTLEALLGWQGDTRRYASMPWLVFAFAFLVIPVGIASITLIILQPVVVGAWCSWCLATALSMLLMIVLTGGELAAACQVLKEAKKKGESVWKVLWKGTDATPGKQKKSFHKKSGGWGVTLPWNLCFSFLLGIWLMASSSVLGIDQGLATVNYILGPLVAAISIIALSEALRSVRYFNFLLGVCLVIAPWFVAHSGTLSIVNNILVGLIILVCAFPKGRISERYGTWQRLIF